MFMDVRRVQKPGIEINVTWDQGEDKFFTGFKPDLGNGYADFMMEAGTVYNIRIVTGGAFCSQILPRQPVQTKPVQNTQAGFCSPSNNRKHCNQPCAGLLSSPDKIRSNV